MSVPRPEREGRKDAARVEGALAGRESVFEEVIAKCSQVLLRASELTEIDEALVALLMATSGDTIFVEMNVEDPDLGLCSTMIKELARDGAERDPQQWSMVPWSFMPSTYGELSRGQPFGFLVTELDEVERARYLDDPTVSELDVPVFADGRWVGLIGIADVVERRWDGREVRLLTTAAEMLGAFWERREGRKALQGSIEAIEKRHRYEEALIECSRALLSEPDADLAIETALAALMGLTSAQYGFVERNEDVPGLGLCSRVVHLHDPDAAIDEYWERVPWSKMPDSYARLSRGLPFLFTLDDLGEAERAQYADSPYPVVSEVNFPIMVEGQWEGLLGLSDPETVMDLEPDEMAMLQAAADMIGSFWARGRDHQELSDLLRSKDDFVAAVSHELRTPLTTVVGLSAELRDHPDRFDKEQRAEFIELIADQSAELAGIVDDLLVAARLESEDLQIHPSVLDLRTEVQAVLAGLSAGDVAIEGNAVAWADAGRLRQVVRNLVNNAQRYGGPTVRIEIADKLDRSVVRVIDDGEGIPHGFEEMVFEPYQALQTSVTQPDSVGLGLAVSRRLADLMGGDLRYAREGGQTVFSLGLPRRPS